MRPETVAGARDPAPERASGAVPAPEGAEIVSRQPGSLPVAVLAPTGRDAALIARALAAEGLTTRSCSRAEDLAALLERDIGVAVIAEEALDARSASRLSETLDRQPSWSDVPIVLLAGLQAPDRVRATDAAATGRLIARGSVTVLERPVRIATMVSAVRAALRARVRQFEVRHHLEAREQARAEAERARAEAEAANRAKAYFLAAMSHELRTPLNAILGYAQLLEMGLRGPLTPAQLEALRHITSNQRHLQGVVEDILTFSRVERGDLPLEFQDVLLDESLATVHVAVEPQLRQNRIRYEYRPCSEPLVARVDRARLQQVLINFLSNAAKFTPAGGSVVLECTRSGDMASISVRDTGRGIHPEQLERIFEPFVQVSEGYTRTASGSGLGLAISRDLARRMGGEILVSSQVGRGTTFTLLVPLAATSAAPRPAAASESETGHAPPER